jgi:cytochrome oxidase Cu insertion factor (SCO1/SenC/PrrC family)
MSHPERTAVRPRMRRLVAAAAFGSAFLTLAACGSSPSVPNISGGSQLDAVLPTQIANMALTNQDGKTVHLADFKGKTILVQDTMTLCQEQCPIDTATFVGLAKQYTQSAEAAKDVVFLTITVDPARDDPAQLAAYRDVYAPGKGSLPQWQLLTGSPSDIAALWKYFHVYIEKVPSDGAVRNWRTGARLTYDIQHGDDVFFIDGSLRQRYLLDGMPSLGGTIPATIKAFMGAGSGMGGNMKMSNWTVADGMSVLGWMKSQ